MAEGRTTWHSFSFGSHYDPTNVTFGNLVAHNDERLPPGTGYADHRHVDLEIVTWVLDGALRHTSTLGSGVLGPGQAQLLSAGSGVVHAEVADGSQETRFLQAWVRPAEEGLMPAYSVTEVQHGEGWTCLADAGDRGALALAAAPGTSLQVATIDAGTEMLLPDSPRLHVFLAAGQVLLADLVLQDGDAARLLDEGGRSITAREQTHLVVWSLPGPHTSGLARVPRG